MVVRTNIMQATSIIERTMTNEGFEIAREALLADFYHKLASGELVLYQHGATVFTVSADPHWPSVHMFTLDGPVGLLAAGRAFMRDVWDLVLHDFLLAPVLNEKLGKSISYFGWRPCGILPATGHVVYRIDRRKSWAGLAMH